MYQVKSTRCGVYFKKLEGCGISEQNWMDYGVFIEMEVGGKRSSGI